MHILSQMQAVPSFQQLSRRSWCCHEPAGLTDPDPLEQLISDTSLMAFTRKKEKEWCVGRLERVTEGSEPVGSSLLLPAQGAGTSRSAAGSP